MPNYLNRIESDLYKLYSITDGSGEVVEMVAELKEKYDKSAAFDQTLEIIKELRDFNRNREPKSERSKVKSRNFIQFCDDLEREINLTYKETRDKYESGAR